MSTEVLPLGERCNIKCTYCYQEPMRTAGNEGHPKYSMEKMKAALLANGQPFAIFGGEPLLVSLRDLEDLWQFGLENFAEAAKRWGQSANSIQTNGSLITEAHLDLFKKYQVGVGVSVDGPEELNDARWAGDVVSTRAATAQTQWALEEMLKRGIQVSIITTIHKINAAPERLPRLVAWMEDLATRGLRHINIHYLEINASDTRAIALSSEENVAAIMACSQLMKKGPLDVMPLTHMRKLLRGEDRTTCTWNACDPYTTAAVHGVDGQGNLNNCGRTSKEGPSWIKADKTGFERYLSLYYTPQKYGGCQGCRFFYACKGHCPGEGLDDGDWRSKTEHCPTIMSLFETLEAIEVIEGRQPVSLSAQRIVVEQNYLDAWKRGYTIDLGKAMIAQTEQSHGDIPDRPHVDAPHLDTPHVDHIDAVNPHITHSDHNDGSGVWSNL
jgi:uncharacterized protein